jgi:hypothetical protein
MFRSLRQPGGLHRTVSISDVRAVFLCCKAAQGLNPIYWLVVRTFISCFYGCLLHKCHEPLSVFCGGKKLGPSTVYIDIVCCACVCLCLCLCLCLFCIIFCLFVRACVLYSVCVFVCVCFVYVCVCLYVCMYVGKLHLCYGNVEPRQCIVCKYGCIHVCIYRLFLCR